MSDNSTANPNDHTMIGRTIANQLWGYFSLPGLNTIPELPYQLQLSIDRRNGTKFNAFVLEYIDTNPSVIGHDVLDVPFFNPPPILLDSYQTIGTADTNGRAMWNLLRTQNQVFIDYPSPDPTLGPVVHLTIVRSFRNRVNLYRLFSLQNGI